MGEAKLPKLVLFGDPEKGNVSDSMQTFREFSKGKAEIVGSCDIGHCTDEILSECEFAVVFGGDGSIISAARTLSRSKVPVIGVNLGKLGFLAEFSEEELEQNFEQIIAGKVRIERRMMLSCSINRDSEERFCSAAINDVFITAGRPFRTIELQILVDGQPLAGCLSDGLIISTPTGSTAYNLSAGGPIISGKMEAMVITPICPHSLSFRPIVISADSTVEVVGLKLNEGTAVLVDGQISCPIGQKESVKVTKHKGEFMIVNNPIRTRWDTLAAKLSWAEKPKYKRAGKIS